LAGNPLTTTLANDVVLLAGQPPSTATGTLPNLGGFTAMLTGKSPPYPDRIAALDIAIEVLGQVVLMTGVAPRVIAPMLIAFTLVASLISHSFRDFTDAAR
jgi:putative oxidoreductase